MNKMTDSQPDMLVEVAYATPHKQKIIAIRVAPDCTALQAARESGIADAFDDLNVEEAKLGIFGQVVAPGQVLRAGDRVEIYRPLIADPKQVRKERAARIRKERA